MSTDILDLRLISDAASANETANSEKMASLKHGNIGSRLNRYLGAFAEDNNLGLVFDAQTTFKVVGSPTTRQPDVAFVAYEKLPADLQAITEIAPDLAVEVISENEKAYDIEKKVFQYQQSGVRLVWVIYPYSQTVGIYRLASGLLPQIIGLAAELDGEEVLPGFKLALAKLFLIHNPAKPAS